MTSQLPTGVSGYLERTLAACSTTTDTLVFMSLQFTSAIEVDMNESK